MLVSEFMHVHSIISQAATSPSIDSYLSPVENLSPDLSSKENNLVIQFNKMKD